MTKTKTINTVFSCIRNINSSLTCMSCCIFAINKYCFNVQNTRTQTHTMHFEPFSTQNVHFVFVWIGIFVALNGSKSFAATKIRIFKRHKDSNAFFLSGKQRELVLTTVSVVVSIASMACLFSKTPASLRIYQYGRHNKIISRIMLAKCLSALRKFIWEKNSNLSRFRNCCHSHKQSFRLLLLAVVAKLILPDCFFKVAVSSRSHFTRIN